MGQLYSIVSGASTQAPPIVGELEALFEELPDEGLIARLRGPKRRGPKGYDPEILWRCFVTYYYLGLESVSALIRYLEDNPFVAQVCGIESPDKFPSQPTFSRFFSKLATPAFTLALKNVRRSLTCRLFEMFPDFGKSVAIDSTPVKAWSNGAKKGRKRNKKGKRGPKAQYKKHSDPDAGWIVKTDTNGKKKYTWGHKVHLLVDTTYELPITEDTSAGNVHDSKKATPLLSEARLTYGKFNPHYVIMDAAYSSDEIRHTVRRQYRAIPIIDPNPAHKKAVAETEKTAEWRMIYNRRSSVERVNGRLKGHRKLNLLRVRGRRKVRVHTLFSVITCQAYALTTKSRLSIRNVA